MARHIFNPWEIAVAQVLLDGSLARLEPAEVAEVMSLFIPSKFAPPEDRGGGGRGRDSYSARRARYNRTRELTPREEIEATIESAVARLRAREGRYGIELTPEWSKPDHRFVGAWCGHGLLGELVDAFGVPPGDALQLLGQTLDLLDQAVHALADVFGPDHHHVTVQRQAASALSHDGKLERLLGL